MPAHISLLRPIIQNVDLHSFIDRQSAHDILVLLNYFESIVVDADHFIVLITASSQKKNFGTNCEELLEKDPRSMNHDK